MELPRRTLGSLVVSSLRKYEQRGGNLLRSAYRRERFSKQFSNEYYELSLCCKPARICSIHDNKFAGALIEATVSGQTATNLPVGGEITMRLVVVIASRMLWFVLLVFDTCCCCWQHHTIGASSSLVQEQHQQHHDDDHHDGAADPRLLLFIKKLAFCWRCFFFES